MDKFARTPEPPYYAVIFISQRTEKDAGYSEMAKGMIELASEQQGFIGVESVREDSGLGITVSYWKDEDSINAWKHQIDHKEAQRLGKQKWYKRYMLRISKVETAYGFEM